MTDKEFVAALRNNDFIKSIILNHGFSKVDVSRFEHTEEWDDHYSFRNFEIGRWVFDVVMISLSTGDLFLTFWKADVAFAGELPSILGTGYTYQQAVLPQEPSMMRTKVGKVDIAGKTARVSYIITEHQGSKITIHIPRN